MTINPTRDDLVRMFPRALSEWIDALVELSPMLCEHYQIERLEWCHMMGQAAAETDGLSIRDMTENMRFTSAKRIIEVYSYRLRLAVREGPVLKASSSLRIH